MAHMASLSCDIVILLILMEITEIKIILGTSQVLDHQPSSPPTFLLSLI